MSLVLKAKTFISEVKSGNKVQKLAKLYNLPFPPNAASLVECVFKELVAKNYYLTDILLSKAVYPGLYCFPRELGAS